MIGYGPAFNMGKAHAEWVNAVDGMTTIAVCDTDPKRTAAAREELPSVETFNDVRALLKGAPVDLCVIILPHHLHAPVGLQCLKAGKHVVLEKPMCLTAAEATKMIEAAKKAGVMLTVFHNRRHDGDFLAIKEVVQKGIIGDVFHVEMWGGGYGKPGSWWRSQKEISGGLFYDWGAHYLDWLLNIMPGRVASVTGAFHKLVWHEVTNEDHVEALIKFDTGAVADVQFSSIAKSGKPRWRVLGTKGTIVDQGGRLSVYVDVNGYPAEMTVEYKPTDWSKYYHNIGDHLLRGAELDVKPEQARRVIGIIEAAEKSSKSGKAEKVPHE